METDMSDKKTILILDDEVDVVKILKFHLEKDGYDVVMTDNGEDGLNRLKETDIALVILDINMPKMGGVEFSEKMKELGKKIPIFGYIQPINILTKLHTN